MDSREVFEDWNCYRKIIAEQRKEIDKLKQQKDELLESIQDYLVLVEMEKNRFDSFAKGYLSEIKSVLEDKIKADKND